MAEKTKLKIELLLPDIDNADDRCVQRLTDLLATKKGVGRVHLDTREQEVGKICVHFDPTIITVGEVRQFAMQAGVDLANRYGHILVEVGTMTARHARQVAALLALLAGLRGTMCSANSSSISCQRVSYTLYPVSKSVLYTLRI